MSFSLPGIGVDVADRKNAGHAGLESRKSRPGTRLFSSAMPQFATGPSFIGQAEERQHRIARDLRNGVVVAFDRGACEYTVLAFKARDLTDLQIHLPGGDQRTHLFDAVRRGAEIVTPVQ